MGAVGLEFERGMQMKRRSRETPVRVYAFGAKPPTGNAELAREQLYSATVYQNRCIELRAQQRAEYRAARREHWPELAGLEDRATRIKAQLLDVQDAGDETTEKALKAERKEFAPRMAELRAEAKTALDTGNTEKTRRVGKDLPPLTAARLNDEVIAAMLSEPEWSPWWKAVATAERAGNARGKDAREQASGGTQLNHQGAPTVAIPHGTYDMAERAAEAAWKAYDETISGKRPATPQTRAKMAERGKPRFNRFDGSGVLRIQVVGGRVALPADGTPFSVTGQWLQIIPAPKREWTATGGRDGRVSKLAPDLHSKRQARLAQAPGWCTARLRVGSDGRIPVWVEFPVLLHQRPPQGRVTWAALVVKREGLRLRYSLQLTIEHEGFGALPAGQGACAVNFGWRSLEAERYRIAYVVGDDGHHEQLTISRELLARLAFADALASAGDLHFNAGRDAIKAWRAEHPDALPAAAADELRDMHAWHDPDRLRRAVHHANNVLAPGFDMVATWGTWKDARGDWREHRDALTDLMAPYTEIEAWCAAQGITDHLHRLAVYLDLWARKSRHLYGWETRQRQRAIEHRRQIVQCWEKALVQRYAKVLVEDYDLREVESATKPAKDEGEQAKRARKNRVSCAPGEARETLVRLGGAKILLNETSDDGRGGKSQRCSVCGATGGVEIDTLILECPNGHREDRDARNCRNQLADERERSGGDKTPVGARTSTGDAGSDTETSSRGKAA
jgi:hypothetical protein